jgi:uncharacterized protein DUF1761
MVAAILGATLAGFVISAGYYSIAPAVGPPGGVDRPAPGPAVQALVELVRSAAIASLVAGLLRSADWGSAGEGALLGLALWTIPIVLLIGSVVHEGTPVRTAATHAGDWLIKLVAIGAIVGLLV